MASNQMGWSADTPVHDAVMQSIGAATTCWSDLDGAGTFDSERAASIGNELLAMLRSRLWAEDAEQRGADS